MSGNISVVEGLGLLFYVTNPSKSSFKSISECPDYVGQVFYEYKILEFYTRNFKDDTLYGCPHCH